MPDLLYRGKHAHGLVGYCKGKLDEARNEYRKDREKTWKQIEQYWKAEFKEDMRTRESERAKLITPTTQTAVDTAAAELDNVVGYDSFFDIEPIVGGGLPPEEWNAQFGPVFDQIREGIGQDLIDSGSRAEISKAVFYGAMLGAGILKVVSDERVSRILVPGAGGNDVDSTAVRETTTYLRAVNPHKFFPQPGASSIKDAEFVVEEVPLGRHIIEAKIKEGVYNPVRIPAQEPGEGHPKVYEFYGLVPRDLLAQATMAAVGGEDALRELVIADDLSEDSMVEAMVVWVEGTNEPLWAGELPYVDGEKSYRVFGYDTSAGGIFGRGVGHKILQVQKAQDGNIRARLDALAYAIHPMVGVNSLSLVSRRRMKVGPGKQILFNGPPRDAVSVFSLGDVPQSAFLTGQELNQMAQASSGLQNFQGANVDYQSGVGLDVLGQAAINRNRKIVEGLTNFLADIIRLFVWRSVQFNPGKYPPIMEDVRVVIAAKSLTRRSEMAQIGNMLKTVPDSSPAYWRLLIKFFELSDLPDKLEIIGDLEQLAEMVLNPRPPQPTVQEQVLLRQIELEEKRAEVSLRLQAERVRAELVRAAAALERIDTEEVRNKATAILNIARAEAQELGSQLSAYKALVDQLTEEARGTDAIYQAGLIGAQGEGTGAGEAGGGAAPNAMQGMAGVEGEGGGAGQG